jgi:hypothetical protein
MNTAVNEIVKDLMLIENQVLTPTWVASRYVRMMKLAEDANELAGMSSSIAKMALFVIDEGLLWSQKRGGPFESKEEWLNNIKVDAAFGFSRASVYATMADIRMAKNAGTPWPLIVKLLANTPGALREARRNWIDEDGQPKKDLELPDGGVVQALEVASTLSPGEARTYVGTDVGTKTARFVRDAFWQEETVFGEYERRLLVKLHIRSRDDEEVFDLVVDGLKSRDNADWVVRRLGGSGLKRREDEVR